MYDYRKLRARIVEIYGKGSQSKFAKDMGLSEHTISTKLTGQVAWKQPEISKAIKILHLDPDDIPVYFFTLNVQRD